MKKLFAVLVVAFALTTAAMAQAPSIVGLWRTSVTPNGVPPFASFTNFTSDGLSTEFDNSFAPSRETIALGNWVQLSANTFAYTAYNDLYGHDDKYTGTFEVTAKITIDSSGNHYSASFVYTVRTPDGTAVASGMGSATGDRVQVDSAALAQLP